MPNGAENRGSSVDGNNGVVDAEISREIVRIYTEYYGRGPNRARTRRIEELVVCLLEDVFGAAERILVEAGHFEQVRLNRQVVRRQIEPRIRAVVESATGRPVQACLGQITEAGLSCEICILETAPTPADLHGRAHP